MIRRSLYIVIYCYTCMLYAQPATGPESTGSTSLAPTNVNQSQALVIDFISSENALFTPTMPSQGVACMNGAPLLCDYEQPSCGPCSFSFSNVPACPNGYTLNTKPPITVMRTQPTSSGIAFSSTACFISGYVLEATLTYSAGTYTINLNNVYGDTNPNTCESGGNQYYAAVQFSFPIMCLPN